MVRVEHQRSQQAKTQQVASLDLALSSAEEAKVAPLAGYPLTTEMKNLIHGKSKALARLAAARTRPSQPEGEKGRLT